MSPEYKIGLARGELGRFVQAYMKELGVEINMDGPMVQRKKLAAGGGVFRIMRSRDVPRWVGDGGIGYDLGITGNDVVWDEIYSGKTGIGMRGTLAKRASELGFGNLNGKLAVLGTEDFGSGRRKISVVCCSNYPNIVPIAMSLMNISEKEYQLTVVQGSVEGYISGGDFDLAIDTIYSGRTIEMENQELAKQGMPKIKVIREIMGTSPVLIWDNKKYKDGDFYELFMSPY